ncbi:MAG TPA: AMP-binding protein [Pseudonocardia sp.]|jgi:fatty-acyl-CoA synthase|nr:AMP-binding protein [Pseudonocardia sp.]
MTQYHYLSTLRALAEGDPDRLLLKTPTTERTAVQLLEHANRLSGYLRVRGVDQDQPVALMMGNRVEVVEGFFAGLALGSPPANVNPRYRPAEVAHLINDCGAGALLYESSVAEVVRDTVELLNQPVLTLETGSAAWAEALAAEPAPAREPLSTDRLLIYTGGTTGIPRAVEWEVGTHYQMIWQMIRHDEPPPTPRRTVESGRRGPTAMPCSPFLHGVGLSLSLNTLNGGGLLVLTESASFDAAQALHLAEENAVAVMGIVGDAFARPLLHELESGRWQGRLGALRAISSSGAAWSGEVRARMREFLPNTALISNFGSTEALVTRDMTDNTPFTPERAMVILDEDHRPVPPGQVGMLATSGNLPLGYLSDPDRTARTFPVIDGRRYAITGDEAKLEPDGRIRVLGRGTSVINTGGEKVWPEEIEAVLRGHPDVLDAVVVGRTDERWGQRVTAVLQLRPGSGTCDEQLAARCKAQLAAYKCPKEWVSLPTIPRTAVGKPDFAAIHTALERR